MNSLLTLCPSTRTTSFVVASAAAICIAALPTVPAQATTESSGGGAGVESTIDVAQVVAARKGQMAGDFVTFGASQLAHLGN